MVIKAFKKHGIQIYEDRGKVGRRGKITWQSLLQRIRVSKHRRSKIRI